MQIQERDAAHAARGRLLHARHRQDALPPAAQPARLPPDDPRRVRPRRVAGLPQRLPKLVLVGGARRSTPMRPASAGTTTAAATYALPENLHPTRWTGDVAVSFLKEYQRPEPFFLKVSFARPHSPYDPPERFMKMYEDADVPPARGRRLGERATTARPTRRIITSGAATSARSRFASRAGPTTARSASSTSRSAASSTVLAGARLARQHADPLHRRPRRHARRPSPVAEDLRVRGLGPHPHARPLAREHGREATGRCCRSRSSCATCCPRSSTPPAWRSTRSEFDGRSMLDPIRGRVESGGE